ncbi:hypothetical protein [Faecalibaculum rodentium]|uniref:hypothetical protein n=1 Tax=Faecalibaculum rodentium TaxID=1702221 RepID=UPI0023F4C12B|nr:hypothetical protein [Faecalibaculum rodentium]
MPELSYPMAGYLLPDDLPAARNTVRAAAENRTRFSQLIPPETLQYRKMADSAIPGDVFYSWMPMVTGLFWRQVKVTGNVHI